MPDITAGTVIKAQDFPPSQSAFDSTVQANQTSTSYGAGSPEIGTTFLAATSGRCIAAVSASIRDNAASNDGICSFQIFEGSSSSGTEIVSPAADDSVRFNTSEYASATRCKLITGLTPGTTYYIRAMHRVTGGSSVDFGYREVTVWPVP